MGRYSDSSDDAAAEYYQAQSWRKQGAEEERERIIKLLKTSESTCADWAIALIEGEINA
jgi:hypothetical protein